MMNSFKILKQVILLMLLFFLPFLGYGQEIHEWTLEECITYARNHNINVKKQMLNVQLQKINTTESKLTMLPTLGGNATHVYNWGQTIDPFTNQFATERVRSNSFYVSTQMVLFSGFQKLNTLRKSQLDLNISELEVEKMMNDISLNVATFYLQALYNAELLNISESQLKVVKLQRDRIKILVESGSLAQGELLNMEAQVASAELQLVEARNNYELALLQLSQLIDLEDSRGFSVVAPELAAPSVNISLSPVDQVVNYALQHQPEIISSKYRIESARKEFDINRGSYGPTLALNGSWGTGYSGVSLEKDPNVPPTLIAYPIGITQLTGDTVIGISPEYSYRVKPFGDQLKANENQSLGLYLNIPIFNGYRSRNNVQRTKIAVANAELDLQLSQNNLRKLIVQAYADASAALKKYVAAETKLHAQQESFNYASEKYAVGLLNAVEYNQNKEDLNKAQSELIQAKYDFIFKVKILDFYEGKPLVLN
ncbi:MAG TPA: TolC family protein [Bacteroidales bacterium]|jgi:outer membrane protein|nr:TolC family protein [Bacteroidales bacterium]MDI9574497.1 TolC family protein [Bacteroidota bacterium]OQC59331.1 MAG: Outer membrane efflux protein BepC precursor [Bacteroidetes bacterium ADurb.Bin012]MBP9512272.1 TolC family protein [Bacteroidales bacterium]MBP9588760.1 TolC family protein [Bacteroidales bacterium]